MRFEDMPALHQRVLETLTEARTTTSAVTLAADLWRSGSSQWGADPVWLVQSLLDELNEQGLVIFRMQAVANAWSGKGPTNPYSGFATQIRLTRNGWALMGYAHLAYQVGTRGAHTFNLDPYGDRTNFRKHNDRAEGGPIETMTFSAHRWKYPFHRHNYGNSEEENAMPRQYTRVQEQIEGTVLGYRSRFPTASYQDIAEALDIPERQVRYVLADLPRLRRSADGDAENKATQKERILDALDGLDFKDINNLIRTLGRGDSAHDVVHALHDLKKQGLVTFSENGKDKSPSNIRMSDRGRKASGVRFEDASDNPLVGETQEQHMLRKEREFQNSEHGDGAMPGEDEVQAVIDADDAIKVLRTPIMRLYPMLDELQAREARRHLGDAKALQYIAAAELIRANDPETARLLDAKAEENDVPFPTPLEAEYLRYVEEHEGSNPPEDEDAG